MTVIKDTRGVEEAPGGLSKWNTSSEKVHHSAMGVMLVPLEIDFERGSGLWLLCNIMELYMKIVLSS